MLYAGLSTRAQPAKQSTSIALLSTEDVPDNNVQAAPIISLLPLALTASSIPLHLLSVPISSVAVRSETLFSILPLMLMTVIRGDDDSWDVGALAGNVAMFGYVTSSGVISLADSMQDARRSRL